MIHIHILKVSGFEIEVQDFENLVEALAAFEAWKSDFTAAQVAMYADDNDRPMKTHTTLWCPLELEIPL